jgi:hypothetical protein
MRLKPTDNATIEWFNGRFRDECLNVHWFASLEDAQQKIDAFLSFISVCRRAVATFTRRRQRFISWEASTASA